MISGVANAARTRSAMDAVQQRLVRQRRQTDPTLRPAVRQRGPAARLHQRVRAGHPRERRSIHPRGHLGRAGDGVAGSRRSRLELWNLINPVYHATTPEEVQHYKVEPYVVCADVYGAPPHTGRGGWTWYTGSASWLYRVALETILGFHLRGGTLRFEPCIPPSWPGFEMTYRHRIRDLPDSRGQLGRHGSRRPIGRVGRATIAEARSAAERRRKDSQGPRGIGLTESN